MNINHIPKELQNLRCWRLEPDKKTDRTTKVPYNPYTGFKASPFNPSTWETLEEALLCAEKYLFNGVGFVFTKDTGIVGIYIDHCIEDGKPNAVAADILSCLPPTYIEISPSGRGLYIFLKGKLSRLQPQ